MKKVFSSDDTVMTGHVQSLLEANGIDCHLRNMTLSSGIGELPLNECWPEVWVNDPADYDDAEELIDTLLFSEEDVAPWTCPCGEVIEGQFDQCWSCGHWRADH